MKKLLYDILKEKYTDKEIEEMIRKNVESSTKIENPKFKIPKEIIKVSIIICTKNMGKYLDRVIKSVKLLKPYEIIIVDAHSEDETSKIAIQHKCKIVYDKGLGIGNARAIGLKEATGDYILYFGPDNVIQGNSIFGKKFIDILIKNMLLNKWGGIGIRSISDGKGYFAKGLNLRWINKIKPGDSKVIGSPFLFQRETLNKLKFNKKAKYSDDTELCEKIKVGYYSGINCVDIYQGKKESIDKRFIHYGISDREYFNNHYKKWGILRIIKSLLHPLNEFSIISKPRHLIYLPFVIYIVILRYIGYIRGK